MCSYTNLLMALTRYCVLTDRNKTFVQGVELKLLLQDLLSCVFADLPEVENECDWLCVKSLLGHCVKLRLDFRKKSIAIYHDILWSACICSSVIV